MCLAIPSKVIALEGNTATLETLGVQRRASLDLMDEPVDVGDFVLLHIGFVVGKIDTNEALESLKLYAEMVAKMEQDG
ncbi:HypC/HybG/HupF family hydrogenase formation chaperone [Helicobacter ailurogastricus]|uniref:[NiFe] hydrogenase metallocenter assembly protein HypC n=1 Tax=Helicobacter ailurogastricus TaxID=1578720 RepID=A0A0K2XJH1_9HELI|nr:HypC/HybG/HupF family hydrogenase formation chaperone [Helicobacter ailurogastricus]CRF40517.1 [NiFe] hydrogenase metallocenter assembly protein HypC [Helicobacter ailurogastricus]CRF42808.1 [NiFe] hydrogenase metallocenter assembly protein HypC [Helicobacter ailurogastricus]CRF44864.1 [NiFe] hydrogenase metallocenter assembly protein HypC [Helicobacter ailurogastricus]GLH58243.1 Hydrogenase assembly chaperone HypC/HupF [Helicobacter ailurogastricus]GLH59115.1 Hydrogenase assembly chaperone